MDSFLADITHGTFAKPGTYTPPGVGAVSVGVDVIVDLAIDSFNDYGQLIGNVDTAEFKISQAVPEKGGTLSDVEGFNGMEWEIIKREDDDGILVIVHLDRK